MRQIGGMQWFLILSGVFGALQAMVPDEMPLTVVGWMRLVFGMGAVAALTIARSAVPQPDDTPKP